MSKTSDIRIKKSGAFRIRSAEASRVTIEPFPGTPPKPRSSMPKGQVAGVKALRLKPR